MKTQESTDVHPYTLMKPAEVDALRYIKPYRRRIVTLLPYGSLEESIITKDGIDYSVMFRRAHDCYPQGIDAYDMIDGLIVAYPVAATISEHHMRIKADERHSQLSPTHAQFYNAPDGEKFEN